MTLRPQYISHVTRAGERWDLLAWRYYGDPTGYSNIIMANGSVPIEPAFDSGMTILIPLLEKPSILKTDLPPWKRAQETAA